MCAFTATAIRPTGRITIRQNHYIEVEVIGKPLSSSKHPAGAAGMLRCPGLKQWQFPALPAPYQPRPPAYLSPFPYTGELKPTENMILPGDFSVPDAASDVAAYGRLNSSSKPISGSLSQITWRFTGFGYSPRPRWAMLPPGVQWVQIDLDLPRPIYSIRFWHYFEDGRTYRDVIVQTADDEKFTRNVRTLFNNDGDNSTRLGKGRDKEYAENERGMRLDTRGKNYRGVTTRFVRFYSRGNSVNPFNHYVSIEIVAGEPTAPTADHDGLILWKTSLPFPLPFPSYV